MLPTLIREWKIVGPIHEIVLLTLIPLEWYFCVHEIALRNSMEPSMTMEPSATTDAVLSTVTQIILLHAL